MRRLTQLGTVVSLVAICILLAPSAVSKDSTIFGPDISRPGSIASVDCSPLSYPLKEQCAHVREACAESESFLSLPHLQGYFCATPSIRPLVFLGLLVWLAFLFSTLGICASDFFCPNLATIAAVLGLDENVAGVTILAVGNGSPDLFSTFSAMKANSGSLAIGELLGAASFIVSVVVGSMCLIKPFHVNPRPFLRDVGFFTVSITSLLIILHDGKIHLFEALTLVFLYIFYVGIVVFGTWWDTRRDQKRRRELTIRGEYEEDSSQPYYVPYRDDVTPERPLTLDVPTSRPRAVSNPIPPRSASHMPRRNSSATHSPGTSPAVPYLPSFSLLTALEFRDVVASLQNQTSGSLAVLENSIASLGGRQYLRRASSRSSLSSPHLQDREIDLWEDSPDPHMHLGPLNGETAPSNLLSSTDGAVSPIPTISVHPPTSRTPSLDDVPIAPPTRSQRIFHGLRETYHILFPHLHNFSSKSITSTLVAIFATPGVLALTVTLPVVMIPYDGPQQGYRQSSEDGSEGRLIDFEEDGVERPLVAEDELKEELYKAQFNKWLTAAQCALGPIFCVAMILGRDGTPIWYFIAVAATGVSAAVLVLIFADKGQDPAARLARCFMGFLVAVVWIMAIADEVVGVLKTFGLVFGLSEAIIGLTIFAIGNSLADLVANTSVAAFAPIMAFSACFGGPMLNLLIGVGVTSSYMIERTGQEYNLRFSTTLLVSAGGLLVILLTTMVFIPWNGYFLSRKWGIFLITSYIVFMAVNIIVEVRGL